MGRDECLLDATSDTHVGGGDGVENACSNNGEVNVDNNPPVAESQQLKSNTTGSKLLAGLPGEDIRSTMISDVSNYINFDKLLDPESHSHYGYSEANRSQRQLLEKIKKKKKDSGINPLDVSTHRLRFNVLSDRVYESAYRGPAPQVKPVIKGLARGSTSSGLSIESLPASRSDGGEIDGNQKPLKRCSFSCVDIREHERIAGDNPCVSKGVPLSIGWGFYQHDSISLDTYETNKGPPRDKIEMMVPEEVRKQMLIQEFKVSLNEINAAIKSVNIAKKQRRQTVANEHLEGWEEVMQSAKRKLNRFTKKTTKTKEEEKLWEEAQKNARAAK